MTRYIFTSTIFISFLLLSAYLVQAQEQQIISNQGEITIPTKSENVWKVLTNTKKYARVMGYNWKSGKKNVDSVGDQALVEFLEQRTVYEVTMFEPAQKIGIKIAPSNSEYVNEKTWVVVPVNKWKTKVIVTDVYTLPSDMVPPSIDQQINALQDRLEELRDLAERS